MTREPEILINNIVNFNQFYIFQMESHMMKASQRERGQHWKCICPVKSPEFILLEIDNGLRGIMVRFLF